MNREEYIRIKRALFLTKLEEHIHTVISSQSANVRKNGYNRITMGALEQALKKRVCDNYGETLVLLLAWLRTCELDNDDEYNYFLKLLNRVEDLTAYRQARSAIVSSIRMIDHVRYNNIIK